MIKNQPEIKAGPEKLPSGLPLPGKDSLWRVIKNFLSLSGGEVLARALTFLNTIYLARVLSAQGFGTWQFALAILGYFMLLTDAGFDHLGQREIAREHGRLEYYAGNIILLRLVLAGVSYALLLELLYFWPQTSQAKDLLLLYGLTLFTFPLSLKWAFWGLEKMHVLVLSNLLLQVFFTLEVFGVIKSEDGLRLLPLLQLAAELAVGLGLLLVFRRLTSVSLWRGLHLGSWPGLLRQSLPIALSQLMGLVRYNFDVVLLGLILGELYVGWYSAAYRIIAFLMLFVTAYSTALMPVLARAYNGSREEVERLMAISLRIMAALTIPLATGGVLVGPPLIELVFGKGYEHSVIAFQFLLWSVVLLSLSGSYRLLLRAFNFQHRDAQIVVVAAVVNIVCNLVLIRGWGLIGTSLATIASELVLLGLAYWQVRYRIFAVPVLAHLVKPILASALMGAYLVWLHSLSIFFLVPTATLIYLAGLSVLHGLTWREVQIVFNRIRK